MRLCKGDWDDQVVVLGTAVCGGVDERARRAGPQARGMRALLRMGGPFFSS